MKKINSQHQDLSLSKTKPDMIVFDRDQVIPYSHSYINPANMPEGSKPIDSLMWNMQTYG